MATPEPQLASGAGVEADFLAQTLDQRELERLRQAVAEAEGLLGREAPTPEPGPETLPALIAALQHQLEGQAAAADEAEREAHELQLHRLRSRFEQRREAFKRIEAAVARLREITSPPAILDAAPAQLCAGSGLDRALLSTVSGGAMVASAAHVREEPERAAELLATLADRWIRLEHPLLEAEVLRRRRATVVADAQLHPRVSPELTEAMGWRGYVVAPVVVHGRVIAVLHADRRGGQLDVIDRDVLWRFAVGFAQAYESASLRRGLRQERDQMRRFLDRLDARLGELSDSAIHLSPWEAPAGADAEARRPLAGDDVSAFDGLLTRREVEVLALMAEGLSNRRIADRLVISEGTVKYHANSIFKKMRAANRAEAVSRYLTRLRSSRG